MQDTVIKNSLGIGDMKDYEASRATLVKFDKARLALAEARSLDEVKLVRDQAQALRLYVRQQGESLEMQNDIAEIKLRAERRAGELLADIGKAKGGGDTSTGIRVKPVQEPQTLGELGISKTQSHRWQMEATVPEETFEQFVTETNAKKEDLTSIGLYRLGQKLKQEEERQYTAQNVLGQIETDKLYHCIVIDPPWPAQKILREKRPNQDVFDYPTMTTEEIATLPIEELADPGGCHVYLWTTHKFLPVSFQLFERWHVKYECLMTWRKNVGFTPFSWMYDTEHVLFGRIGSLEVIRKGLRLSFDAPVTKHSEKPDVFYERVIEASPELRLDMFARRPREGFRVWGNEI